MDENVGLLLSSQNSKMNVRKKERNKQQKESLLIPLYEFLVYPHAYFLLLQAPLSQKGYSQIKMLQGMVKKMVRDLQ